MLTTNRFNLMPVTVVSQKTTMVITRSPPVSKARGSRIPYRAFTAPSRTTKNVVTSIHGYQRQPSTPEIRPFSEERFQQPILTDIPRRDKRKRKQNIPYYKDRSYLSSMYSWAKSDQEETNEAIKGLDLARGILRYKPSDSPEPSTNGGISEVSIRPGLGYTGYMDCLLRGRKKHINKKVTKEAAKIEVEADNEPTLVPSNSLVKEK